MPRSGRQYLFVSDSDQTLSFNDSGLVLSKLLGVDGFDRRVAGLSEIDLVQQITLTPSAALAPAPPVN